MAVIHKLVVFGRLDGLNEYTTANRTVSYKGAKMKHKNEKHVSSFISYKMRNMDLKYPISLKFCWYEKNRKRDPDNICFAKKFILDAMVKSHVLPNDSQKYIKEFHDLFYVDKDNPRIEIFIEEGD